MNFEEIEDNKPFENKYMVPGTEVLTISEISSGLSSKSNSPYIKIKCVNAQNQQIEKDTYLNGGALKISTEWFLDMLAAGNNLENKPDKDRNALKAMIGTIPDNPDGSLNKEALARKLATLLVGKSFATILKGEWVTNKDPQKDSWKKAVMTNIAVSPSKLSTLKYDEVKHTEGTFIKGLGTPSTNGQLSAQPKEEVKW